jgi:succinoglycan biosynthesis transport protein ExoP
MDATQEIKLHFLDYWRVVRVRIGLVLLVFLLVVISVGIATYLAPRKYRSFATIEVTPDLTPVRIFDKETGASTSSGDSRFTQTQFQIIQRKGVLYPVIDRLKLQNRWAQNGSPLPEEVAYNRLRSMLSLQEVRNTNLIQIDVLSRDPQEAALLANTIANVYMEQRVAEQQSLVTSGLDQLRAEVEQKEESVSKAYAEASRLRTEANIIDPNPDSLEGGSRVEDSSVISNQEKVNEARSQVATLKSRVEQIDRLKSEDLMRVASQLNLNDPVLDAKLPIYQTAVAEKARLLSSGLGPNHPEVKALQAQIDTVAGQLRQQIDSIRKGLVTQEAIAESSLKSLESNFENSQTRQQEMKTASAQYLDAKYRYIQERKLLETAKTRLNTESMERTMPQKAAFIRDAAEAALFPSSPKVILNMVLAVVAGLILGIGLAFFLEYLDTSVKTLDDVEKFLELPVLAVVPKGAKILRDAGEDIPDAEAYRILKTNIDINRKNLSRRFVQSGLSEGGPVRRNLGEGEKIEAKIFSIVSGGPGEGKSTTVCNLGTVWAAAGQKVLIVDADMRRPTQHHLFESDNRAGLGNYLRKEKSLDDVIHTTTSPNLLLIPGGNAPHDTVSLLNSDQMNRLLDEVRCRFDVVLFDCPPILGVSDSSIMTNLADATIIVTQHRRFPRSMLARVKKTVLNAGGNLLGVVLNNVDVRHDHQYQYYTSYYHYYPGPKSNGERTTEKPAPARPVARAKSAVTEDEY